MHQTIFHGIPLGKKPIINWGFEPFASITSGNALPFEYRETFFNRGDENIF